MKTKNKKIIGGAAVAAGAAAIGAALYYLYGTESGKKHRLKMVAWMKDAQKDIVDEVKKLKDSALTEDNYRGIVRAVSKRYEMLKNVDPDAVAAFMVHANSLWKTARSQVMKSKSTGTRRTSAKKRSVSKT